LDEIPTKPYLLRALYEWCVDNGYTPHIAVKVDSRTHVPAEHVKAGDIVLNISPSAVHKLRMGNDLVEFSARFGGVARQISVPVANIYAVYARETGHGMTFDIEAPRPAPGAETQPATPPMALPAPAKKPEPPKPGGGKPTKPQLRRVK
jgi:stringent starvation protein B